MFVVDKGNRTTTHALPLERAHFPASCPLPLSRSAFLSLERVSPTPCSSSLLPPQFPARTTRSRDPFLPFSHAFAAFPCSLGRRGPESLPYFAGAPPSLQRPPLPVPLVFPLSRPWIARAVPCAPFPCCLQSLVPSLSPCISYISCYGLTTTTSHRSTTAAPQSTTAVNSTRVRGAVSERWACRVRGCRARGHHPAQKVQRAT